MLNLFYSSFLMPSFLFLLSPVCYPFQGGTLASAIDLIRSLGGVVIGCIVIIDLADCGGRTRLVKECGLKNEDIHALFTY